MEKFEKLGLSQDILKVLDKMGFEKPTEIQEKTIPLVLAGKDVIGGSATGSGKTLAFASPIIDNVESGNGVQALILTPTRELAEQVADSITKFSGEKKLNVLPIYGGVDIERQIRKLPRIDVVVGTPGRILDHMRRNTLRLNKIKFLVLDEVDRMFDMGFHKDVEMIIGQCPKERQTMLFSATISSDMDHLAQKYTNNAEEVVVASHVDPSKLSQIYYDVPSNMKFSLLVHLLKKERAGLIMVFCSTRRNVDFVVNNLGKVKVDAKGIHGGMVQNKRLRVLQEFNARGIGVLVCTDVAARGLDIKGVSHVYNYDIPNGTDDYIHRIGRTARAGKEGKAISILASRDYENFGNILRRESLMIHPEELPKFQKVMIRMDGGRSDRLNVYSREGGRTSGHGRDGRPRGGSRGRDPSRGRSGPGSPRSGGNYSRGSSDRRQSYRGRSDSRSSQGRTGERRPIQGRHGSRDSRGSSRDQRSGRDSDRGSRDRGPSRGRSDSRGGSSYSRGPSRGREGGGSSYSRGPSRGREGGGSSYSRGPSRGSYSGDRRSSEGSSRGSDSGDRRPRESGRKPSRGRSESRGKSNYSRGR